MDMLTGPALPGLLILAVLLFVLAVVGIWTAAGMFAGFLEVRRALRPARQKTHTGPGPQGSSD